MSQLVRLDSVQNVCIWWLVWLIYFLSINSANKVVLHVDRRGSGTKGANKQNETAW